MTESVRGLLEQAVAGEAQALRTLLKRFGPQARLAIRGKIDRKWRPVLDEDDVMQVVYLEAFLHIDQLEAHDGRSFTGWLTRIAENALRDAIREQGLDTVIGIDGGIGNATIADAAAAGVDSFVAGSAVFGADDPAQAVDRLRELAREARQG